MKPTNEELGIKYLSETTSEIGWEILNNKERYAIRPEDCIEERIFKLRQAILMIELRLALLRRDEEIFIP